MQSGFQSDDLLSERIRISLADKLDIRVVSRLSHPRGLCRQRRIAVHRVLQVRVLMPSQMLPNRGLRSSLPIHSRDTHSA